MIKYQVRSRDLLDVVNEIKNRRLIMSPYFQRNLVWRMSHKIEFIKTILMGFPFPQIFVAKGSLDIENMEITSCIVDGQQRMNAIVEFLNDVFMVDNMSFSNLPITQKTNFLKYQIPIIDLDIANEDPKIIEIFKRLNNTFYSLSTIEKIATEYAASEFMLTAKFLINEFKLNYTEEDVNLMPLQNDPNVPSTFIEWATGTRLKTFTKFVLDSKIFTPYELSRKVHLMFTLNIMATVISDYYNRNDLAMRYLDEFANEFPNKNDLMKNLEFASNKFLKLSFKKNSYWLNKANSFSLFCAIARNIDKPFHKEDKLVKEDLENFGANPPQFYLIAAKEGVNNRKERLLRRDYIHNILFGDPVPNDILSVLELV